MRNINIYNSYRIQRKIFCGWECEYNNKNTAVILPRYSYYVSFVAVNCAGYGVIGDFADLGCEEQMGMIRLNCEALTHVTHVCVPFMAKNSRIIQIASCAAFIPQPGFAIYAATKAYVESFSKALREELKGKKIYVTTVCPGPIDTPFFDIAEKTGKILAIKKATMVDAASVARKALKDSCTKKSTSVYSLPIQAVWVLTKLVPHGLVMPLMRAYKESQQDV